MAILVVVLVLKKIAKDSKRQQEDSNPGSLN